MTENWDCLCLHCNGKLVSKSLGLGFNDEFLPLLEIKFEVKFE